MTTSLRTVLLAAILAGSTHAFALNIVLSNDDGWSAPGVQAMKRALVAAGHNVYLVAPLDEQSGSSAAINLGSLTVVKQRDLADEGALEYSVALSGGAEGAEPATAAMVGIGIARQATGAIPNLVVSGINSGQNLGSATQISGTVGVATVALATLGGAQIPAIAISTDEPCDAEKTTGCAELNKAQYDRVAAFVARLIAQLNAEPSAPLMPVGVGLNINYPPIDPVKGAKVSRQGRALSLPGTGPISITFGCLADCIGAPKGVPIQAGPTGFPPIDVQEAADADTTDNHDGYITIVPIVPDYTAGPWTQDDSSFKSFRGRLDQILHSMYR